MNTQQTEHDFRELVHGYPICATRMWPKIEGLRYARRIIVDRGEDAPQRYVVAWHNPGDAEWSSGFYCDTIEAAFEELAKTYRQ